MPRLSQRNWTLHCLGLHGVRNHWMWMSFLDLTSWDDVMLSIDSWSMEDLLKCSFNELCTYKWAPSSQSHIISDIVTTWWHREIVWIKQAAGITLCSSPGSPYGPITLEGLETEGFLMRPVEKHQGMEKKWSRFTHHLEGALFFKLWGSILSTSALKNWGEEEKMKKNTRHFGYLKKIHENVRMPPPRQIATTPWSK